MSSGTEARTAIAQVPMKLQRWLDAALSDEEIGQMLQGFRREAGVTRNELAPFLYLSESGVSYRELGRMHWTPETVTETLAAIERAAKEKPASQRRGSSGQWRKG